MSSVSFDRVRSTTRAAQEQHDDLVAGLSVSLILSGVILMGLLGMIITVLWTL